MNILGTMLAMVDNTLGSLGQGLDLPASAELARTAIRREGNAIDSTRLVV